MKRFEDRITITAPRERVLSYVSDFPRHGEWAANNLNVAAEGDGPVAVGSTYSTEAKQFGTQREKSTVTELTPGQVFGWDSKGALGVVHHWFSLAGDGDSTSLTKGMELTHPSFLAKMMGFRINKEGPKGLRHDLEQIKSKLESSPQTS